MKRSLVFKLILCYIILISIFYLAVNAISSLYLNNYLYNDAFDTMEDYANSIINNKAISSYYNEGINYDEFCKYIDSVSSVITPVIWLTDSDCNIIYDSSKNVSIDSNICIKDLDKSFFSTNHHESIYFQGLTKEEYISYNCQIKNESGDFCGYIILNSPEDTVSNTYTDLILHINYLALLMLPLAAVVFILIYFLTIEPVHRITKYAVEYSKGKFDYKLVIKTNDEYKQLSDAIEYMVGELNNLDEYQRKFIGNISHDFRSPLTSIKGYIEAMIDGTIPVENQEKYMKIILFEAERLKDLTTNLLTLNNFDNNKRILDKKSFDINNILKKTAEV